MKSAFPPLSLYFSISLSFSLFESFVRNVIYIKFNVQTQQTNTSSSNLFVLIICPFRQNQLMPTQFRLPKGKKPNSAKYFSMSSIYLFEMLFLLLLFIITLSLYVETKGFFDGLENSLIYQTNKIQ